MESEALFNPSYIIVGLIWLAIIILSGVLYCLFPPEIYYWNKVCDKCNTTTAKYRYVIRFIFKSFKSGFQLSKTTITIEIWDKKRALVTVQITPKQMEEFIPNCPNAPMKTVRFLLYRKDPLNDISYVVINHNGYGSINVSTLEIQEIRERFANISHVGTPVQSLNKVKANIAQKYPSATRDVRPMETELKTPHSLTSMELMVFFFLAINVILLLPVYVIPCLKENFCNDYNEGFLSSVFSGLFASTIGALALVLSCSFHRYVIKQLVLKEIIGSEFIRYLVLFLAIVLGSVFGISAAVMATHHQKFPEENKDQEFTHELFWFFAVGIALIVFFLFWVSILLVVGRCIGFFSEPKDIEIEVTMRTNTELDYTEDSTDYMNELIKHNTKVKSISQYGGLSQAAKPPVKKPEPSPSKETKAPKRTASVESTGSNYYKELMKGQGKVKSVSQYKGPGK